MSAWTCMIWYSRLMQRIRCKRAWNNLAHNILGILDNIQVYLLQFYRQKQFLEFISSAKKKMENRIQFVETPYDYVFNFGQFIATFLSWANLSFTGILGQKTHLFLHWAQNV